MNAESTDRLEQAVKRYFEAWDYLERCRPASDPPTDDAIYEACALLLDAAAIVLDQARADYEKEKTS